MDWVHCNLCFAQPLVNKKTLKFFLTNCGHTYCINCVDEGTVDKCKQCGNKCTVIPLEQMKPDVQEYFQDPNANAKKTIRILEFQSEHRRRLVSYHRKLLNRMPEMAEKMNQMAKQIADLEKDNKYLRQLAEKLGYRQRMSPRPSIDSGRITTPTRFPQDSSVIQNYRQRSQQQMLPSPTMPTPCGRQLVTPNRVTLRHLHGRDTSAPYNQSHSAPMAANARPPYNYRGYTDPPNGLSTPTRHAQGMANTPSTITGITMSPLCITPNYHREQANRNMGGRIIQVPYMSGGRNTGRGINPASIFSGLVN